MSKGEMSELKVMTFNKESYKERDEKLLKAKRARRRALMRRRKRIARLTCVLTCLFVFLIVVLFVLIFHKKDKPAPISITSIDISTESVALEPVTIIPPNNTDSNVSEQVISDTETIEMEDEVEKINAISEPAFIIYDIPISNDLQEYIYNLSKEYDVDVALIFAVMEHESSFDPNARSESGDSGLMQVNDINLETLKKELGIDDIFDPYQNVLGGTYLLSKCLKDANGEIHPALMCYNMGRSNAKECWNKGIYSSKYSRAVYSLYENEYQR